MIRFGMFLIRKYDFTLHLLQSLFNVLFAMSIFLNQGLVILNISIFLKFFVLFIHLFIHLFIYLFVWFCCCCCCCCGYSNIKKNFRSSVNVELLCPVMRIFREFHWFFSHATLSAESSFWFVRFLGEVLSTWSNCYENISWYQPTLYETLL